MSISGSIKRANWRPLLLLAMVLASVVGSLASGWETYLGLDAFTSDNWGGTAVAFGITFMIQVLLFVISWLYVYSPRASRGVKVAMLTTWLVCALCSGGFSYFGFFFDQGGRSGDLRQSIILGQLAELENSMRSSIAEKKENKIRGFTDQTNPPLYYQKWERDLSKLLDIARQAETQLAQAARDRRQELQDLINDEKNRRLEIERRLAQLKTALGAVSAEKDRLEQETKRLTEDRNQLETDISRREIFIAGRQEARDDEASRGGCLTKCRAIEAEIADLNRDLNGVKASLEATEQSLADAQRELEVATTNFNNAPESRDILDLEGQIDVINSEIAGYEAERDGGVATVNLDPVALEQDHGLYLSALRRGNPTGFDKLKTWCTDIQQPLRRTNLAGQLQGIECSPAQMEAAAQEIVQLDTLSANLESCLTDPKRPVKVTTRTREEAPDEGFRYSRRDNLVLEPFFDHTQSCISHTTTEARSDLRRKLRDLRQVRGDNTGPWAVAATSLSDGESNAIISLFFAAAIDALVFLCALIGVRLGTSERARAIDLVFGLVRTPKMHREGVWATLDMPENYTDRELVDEIVRELLPKGLAEINEDKPEQVFLRDGAQEFLRQMRNIENSEPVSQRATDPVEAPTKKPQRRKFEYGGPPPSV